MNRLITDGFLQHLLTMRHKITVFSYCSYKHNFEAQHIANFHNEDSIFLRYIFVPSPIGGLCWSELLSTFHAIITKIRKYLIQFVFVCACIHIIFKPDEDLNYFDPKQQYFDFVFSPNLYTCFAFIDLFLLNLVV